MPCPCPEAGSARSGPHPSSRTQSRQPVSAGASPSSIPGSPGVANGVVQGLRRDGLDLALRLRTQADQRPTRREVHPQPRLFPRHEAARPPGEPHAEGLQRIGALFQGADDVPERATEFPGGCGDASGQLPPLTVFQRFLGGQSGQDNRCCRARNRPRRGDPWRCAPAGAPAGAVPPLECGRPRRAFRRPRWRKGPGPRVPATRDDRPRSPAASGDRSRSCRPGWPGLRPGSGQAPRRRIGVSNT